MEILPAIDLFKGRVVRLLRGKFNQLKVYPFRPLYYALAYQRQGVRWLHIVDLDGARCGTPQNLKIVQEIAEKTRLKIQFGGGLRNFDSIKESFSIGVSRVVLGTKATDRKFLDNAIRTYKDRIAVSLDLFEEKIRIQGWRQNSLVSLKTIVNQLEILGLGTIIVTDIKKDGTLRGPNIALLKKILSLTSINVILSGGISQLKDIKILNHLKYRNFKGVIIGKALYENRFTLKQVLTAVKF